MKKRSSLVALFLVASTALADDPAAIPAKSIAEKKELLFADDFEAAEGITRAGSRAGSVPHQG